MSDSQLLDQMKKLGQAVIAGVSLEGNTKTNPGSNKHDPFNPDNSCY